MPLETELLNGFVRGRSARAARLFEGMSATDAANVMSALHVEELALVLRTMAPLAAAKALELMTPTIAAPALSATHPDAAAAILRAMETAERLTLLGSLTADSQRSVRRLLRFSEGTAGALMDPQVLSVDQGVSVADAIERVRESAQHAHCDLYVVDEEQKLVGLVHIPELIAARPDQQVGLIAHRIEHTMPRGATSASIVRHPGWNRFPTLPVVEPDGRLSGVIRYESMRALEHGAAATESVDEGAETVAALSELYGLGLRSLVDWVGGAVFGTKRSGGQG